jgi:prepilin-type N-terminal cleavage/methylation domain-containing protein
MRTKASKAESGFTMVEILIAVAIIGVLTAMTIPDITRWMGDQRLKAAARSVSDLLLMARGEAVRSGRNHFVCFSRDAAGAPIPDATGVAVPGLYLRDDDGTGPLPAPNGTIDANEPRVFLPTVTGVQFGVTSATVAAPSDPNPNATFNTTGLTFQNGAGGVARCVVFQPDGVPRGYSIAGVYTEGAIGTGGGAVYVTNGRRDYAVVLSPLGAVRVTTWERTLNAWRN